MDIIASLPQSGSEINQDFAEFLVESMMEFVPRNKKSLARLLQENGAQAIVIWQTEGPVLYIDKQKFFFHPSMAKNRIASFRKFASIDPMVKACDIKETDFFLDCTLGLGADAIVASYFAPRGKVLGLESSTPVACIVKWGIKVYNSQMSWLNDAIRRIEVKNCNHDIYLKNMRDNSCDIVYFDPMFRKPLLKSQALAPLRLMANHAPLEKELIEEACRVARKRVVIKEAATGGEFSRLGCPRVIGSPHNKIAFGIIEV